MLCDFWAGNLFSAKPDDLGVKKPFTHLRVHCIIV